MPDRTDLLGHWMFGGNGSEPAGGAPAQMRGGARSIPLAAGEAPAACGVAHALELKPSGAYAEVVDGPPGRLGAGAFTLAAWLNASRLDMPADVLSKFDPQRRRGLQLSLLSATGVTTHQPNRGQLHFGITDGVADGEWRDCGRPGDAVYVLALAVHAGDLYAGTYESGAEQSGHVYRYAGGRNWDDCGAPDPCNSVGALAVHEGRLYAGVMRYRAEGSSLSPSPNMHPGGRIYRYEGGGDWVDCGALPGADSVFGLVSWDGHLYAIPIYSQGVFRYDGGQTWSECGSPGRRLMALGVYRGALYAAGNEGGGVFRYAGEARWIPVGEQAGVTQVYSFATYRGELYGGTWPEGKVFRFDGDRRWHDAGRLGAELEVMGMMVYNGSLYGGTLPLAEIYRYDGEGRWTRSARLDHTEGVRYRRAWSMAIYQGRLFCGTLPSGRVHALSVGHNVTCDHELPPGWRHVAATRDDSGLKLYVDGRLVAQSREPIMPAYDVSNDAPLLLGYGPQNHLQGRLADVRWYGRALDQREIAAMCGTASGS